MFVLDWILVMVNRVSPKTSISEKVGPQKRVGLEEERPGINGRPNLKNLESHSLEVY